MVARRAHNPEVAGSSPVSATSGHNVLKHSLLYMKNGQDGGKTETDLRQNGFSN